ncbi:hypothetical protein MASR1M74_20690 [Lentimicrobium sp.]
MLTLVVSEKGWKTLKQKIKVITRKTTPATFDERIRKLNELQRGWLGYFRMASIQGRPQRTGWVGAQSPEVLHMAFLEKARAEKEKPDPAGC